MLQHMSRRVRDLDDRLMAVLSGARLSTEQVQAIRVSAVTLGYLPPEAVIEATP